MAVSTFDDEAARLVLADQLLARGNLQGELIIVQCELARGGFSRERGIALRKRELELLLAHEDEWANLDGLARNWTFQRGFVDEITIDVKKFADNEDEIFRRAPHLRWLRFTGLRYDSPVDDLGSAILEWDKVKPSLERALASGRVRYFSAEDARVSWMHDGTMTRYSESGSLADAIARWLWSEPAILGGLRGIGLHDVEPFTLSIFARSEAAAGIEELELDGNLFESAHVVHQHYVGTKLAPRRLRLVNARVAWHREELDTLRELLAGPFASRLEDLDTLKLEPVLENECGARLHSLRVSPGYDREIFEAIASSPRFAKLENLALDVLPGRQLDLEIEPFYAPKCLDSLRTIRFGHGVSPERAEALLRAPLAERLELIDLRQSTVTLKAHHAELSRLWDGLLLV